MVLFQSDFIRTKEKDRQTTSTQLASFRSSDFQFGRCARTFGLRDHVEDHVVRAHIVSSEAVIKCGWADCDKYLQVQENKQVQLLLCSPKV